MEYRWIRPEAWKRMIPTIDRVTPNPGLVAEIRRKLQEDPDCLLAVKMASAYGL